MRETEGETLLGGAWLGARRAVLVAPLTATKSQLLIGGDMGVRSLAETVGACS